MKKKLSVKTKGIRAQIKEGGYKPLNTALSAEVFEGFIKELAYNPNKPENPLLFRLTEDGLVPLTNEEIIALNPEAFKKLLSSGK